MLESLASWVQDVIIELGYPGIFVLMIVEALATPVPSEVILPFSGFLASRGELDFWGAVAAGTAGNVVGAWILYFAGRWGDEWVRVFVRRWGKWILVSEHELDTSERLFRRYGDVIVFFSRMIPGVRALISLPAGMARIGFWRYTLFTALGSLAWALVLVFTGYQLGENWEDLEPIMRRFNVLILVLIVVTVGAYVWYKLRSHAAHVDQAKD